MLRGVILGVHVLLALMIIALVLLQRGKGAEAGAGFGSGASGTVFGARGTSLILAYLGSHATVEPTSVLERAAQAAAAAPSKATPPQAPATTPAPGSTPTPAPATPAPDSTTPPK